MKTEDFIEIEKMLNTIIRYLLAGGAAVLAFGVVRPSHFHFLCVDSQQKEISATLTMLFVLVSGAATYLLHRALFFPLIYWCLIRILKSKKSGLAQSRTHNEIVNALTTTRNTRRRGAIPMQSHFDTWAAEVHALYGICLGSLFAIAAALLTDTAFNHYMTIILCGAVLVLIAALNHNWRFLSNEIEACEDLHQPV